MAHRSGGGSHGGGSHGSHGGGSRSHGSSGGSSGPRISRTPFPNSRRFMYYDRRGVQRYIYSDRMPAKMSFSSFLFNMIFFIPFVALGGYIFITSIMLSLPPKPLVPEYAPVNTHIEDNIGVIHNNSTLEKSLQDFEDLTGISPYVMTVYDSDWNTHFGELWEYAYSIYVNNFNDEQHFLIVYSEPKNADELDFVDWSWEAIQGDDTDPILTEDNFWRFQDELHKNLLKDSISVGEAFEIAFSGSLDYIMSVQAEGLGGTYFFAFIWNFFIWVMIITIVRGYIYSKKTYREVPMDEAYSSNVGNYGVNANYGTGMNNNNSSNYGTGMTNGIDQNYNTGTNYGTNTSNDMSTNYGSNTNYGSGTYDDNNTVPWDDDSRYRSDAYYNDSTNYNNGSNNN